MKKIIFLGLMFVIAAPVWAQNSRESWSSANGQVIDGTVRHDVFAGPVLKYSPVNGTSGFFVGGRAAWLINSTYALGLGGYGLVSDIEGNEVEGLVPDLKFQYGGVEFEYIIAPKEMLHFSVYTLVGMGRASFDFSSLDGDDNFLVVEPAANVELNVTDFFKIAMGVGYRIASGVELDGLEDSDFSGLTANLTFKFGTAEPR